MDMTAFLAITQFLTWCVGQTFGALDEIYIITSPNFTVLDYICTTAVLTRIYMFILFCMGIEVEEDKEPPEAGYVYQ